MKLLLPLIIIFLSTKSVLATENIINDQNTTENLIKLGIIKNKYERTKAIENKFEWEVKESTIICKVDEAVGFKWNENKFTKVTFKPDIYVLQKLDNKNIKDKECKEILEIITDKIDLHHQTEIIAKAELKRCYQITRLGEKANDQLCTEKYSYSNLQYIECGTKRFLPDGLYIYQSNIDDLSSISNQKPDIAVSYGQCTKP